MLDAAIRVYQTPMTNKTLDDAAFAAIVLEVTNKCAVPIDDAVTGVLGQYTKEPPVPILLGVVSALLVAAVRTERLAVSMAGCDETDKVELRDKFTHFCGLVWDGVSGKIKKNGGG